jgi:outer membrane PBP1 activator LpoA protein
MAKAFSEAWTATGGNIGLPISIPDKTLFPTITTQLASNPTDMVFLAANADEAREIRPFLNSAIPTFGLSQMNDGLSQANSDNALNAIRFTEIPWVIDHNNEAYKDYYKAAADLPQGEMQRWFALGVDAYHLLAIITQRPNSFSTFNGLTGKISVSATGEIKRELLLGRFTKQGIMLESTP